MDNTHSDFSPFLTKQETARYIRCSLRKLESLVKDARLVPARIDRKLLFLKKEVDLFVETHRAQ